MPVQKWTINSLMTLLDCWKYSLLISYKLWWQSGWDIRSKDGRLKISVAACRFKIIIYSCFFKFHISNWWVTKLLNLNHNIVQKLSPFLTLSCLIGTFIDFTLSNARRFYLSLGNPLGRKELIVYENITLKLPVCTQLACLCLGMWVDGF